MVVTAPRVFKSVREALRASQGHPKMGNKPSEVKMAAKATMKVAVRRFQGIYECGCKADPLEGPENCEIHDQPKKYAVEEVGIFDAEKED